MLNRIFNRIKRHKELVSRHEKGEINNLDFEQYLLDEIAYFQESIEHKLNQEIEEQERKLADNFIQIKDIVSKNNIDKTSLENLIYSELNSMFFKHL